MSNVICHWLQHEHKRKYTYVNEDFLKTKGRYYDEIAPQLDPRNYALKSYHSKDENIA